MRAKCEICKEVVTVIDAPKHAATHDPIRVKPSKNDPLFRVGWKRDGTIRQPKGER